MKKMTDNGFNKIMKIAKDEQSKIEKAYKNGKVSKEEAGRCCKALELFFIESFRHILLNHTEDVCNDPELYRKMMTGLNDIHCYVDDIVKKSSAKEEEA